MEIRTKIPENSMSIQIVLRDDEDVMDIGVSQNLSEDLPEEEQAFYNDVLNGIVSQLNTGLEHLAFVGMLMRQLNEDKDSIEFEAAPELLEAIKDNKVIKMKKKLH